MHNKSALVVDDSRVARMTLSKFLKPHGFEITELGSAEEALDWLKAPENKPAIIFMDVMMEGMDGLTATRQIKSLPELSQIPVIICTGNDSEADLTEAKATGAEAVLSKPPAADAVEVLLKQIEATLSAAPAEAPVSIAAEIEASAVDEQALLAKAMEAFRQSALPELQQQVRNMAEDISRQIAHDVAQETSQSHSQSLIPQLTKQVTESAKATVQEVRQELEQQMTDVLNRTANNALEQALQEYGLTEKMMVVLSSQGTSWLKKQEQPIRENLQKQLQENLTAMVNRYLDDNLPERVNALVKARVEESLTEAELKHEEQMSAIKQQLGLALKLAGGATAVALLALGLSFV